MRLKDYPSREGKRVWLSERELQTLLDFLADDREQRAAGLLMARCGLRRREAAGNDERDGITPADIVSTDHGHVVRVWAGKGDKYREVPAPDELTTLVLGMGKDPDEELISVADSTVYDWVQRARERCHAETGDEGWLYVGPHDLRRSWGVRLLEAGVLPSVVMEWGGWEDWQTFRDHYLAEFSPEALRRERGKVEWMAGGREPDSGGSTPGYAAVDAGSSKPF
jgi:integrase